MTVLRHQRLVYAFLDIDKRRAALDTMSQGGMISAQVLNEFTQIARSKRQRSWPEIEAAIMNHGCAEAAETACGMIPV